MHKKELYGRLVSFVSKKFILSMLIFIVSSILVAQGKIGGEYWLGIMVTELLTYNFSNSIAKKYKGDKNE